MNKIFLLFIGVLLSVSAISQSDFGVKAGLNVAHQQKSITLPDGDRLTDFGDQVFFGYQLGGYYKLPLNKRISLSAEANFSVVGSSRALTTPDGNLYQSN